MHMNYEYVNEFQCILVSSDTVQNDYPRFIHGFVFQKRKQCKNFEQIQRYYHIY